MSSTRRAREAVSESTLRAQLTYLKRRGFVGLTISDVERRREEEALPRRSVVVTFDDGYASTLRALPILEEVDFPGTVFVVTSFVESGEPLSWEGLAQGADGDTLEELRPLTWRQAETLLARGWEIGSHTVTHPLLTRADDKRLHDELVQSRAAIEQRFGTCSSIAYPYGLADDRVAEAARAAGYTVGCTLTFAQLDDEPLRRPRTGMDARGSSLGMRLQVSPLGQAARRSRAARLARAMRRRRDWVPQA